MYSPITLDAIRVLDAIDRKQSFAAAAETLFRVPSAVSYTVSKLEEELGVQIFDRSKRKAVLTPVGRLILEQGRQILNATEELTHMAKAIAEGWEAELRIAIDSLLEFGPIYDLIQEFHALHPRTEIRLIEEVLGGTWDALNSERCDLIIGAEGEVLPGNFAAHLLGQVDFVFAIAANHPLCSLPTPLAAAAIEHYPTVVVADSSRHLPARSSGLLAGSTRIVVPTFDKKIEAHCLGIGVGFLPVHRISRELATGRLTVLPLEKPRPSQQIYTVWRESNKGKALLWFVDRIKQLQFDSRTGLNKSSALPN